MSPVVRLVCLHIADEAGYARYREHMEPLLADHGGRFLLDIQGGEPRIVPEGLGDPPLNRFLAIGFPDTERADAFFASAAYREVRATWFEPAVTWSWSTWLHRPT